MTQGAASRDRWRRAGLWLAFIALALKIAIPAGFMVAPDRHQLVVQLCSGNGAAAVLDLETGKIVEHGSGKNGESKSEHNQPCSFAAAAIAADAPNETVLDIPLREEMTASFRPLDLRPQLAPTGPPLPARGPPHFA